MKIILITILLLGLNIVFICGLDHAQNFPLSYSLYMLASFPIQILETQDYCVAGILCICILFYIKKKSWERST